MSRRTTKPLDDDDNARGPGSGPRLALEGIPRGRWWLFPFKWLLYLALVGATAAPVAYGGLWWYYGDGLPPTPRVDAYWPPILSEAYTHDAVLAGEFYNKRRKVIPYERIPKRLVQAFVAAEDADFFEHPGVDLVSTARAAFKTVSKKLFGVGKLQGGSTLTQQTAKAVLIDAEGYAAATAKTVRRKIREALLARRLEAALTKEQILYLYLNTVYLGHQSYGVQSAAENYFRKDVRALSLAEMALLAGLPQAPSTYSPFRNPEGAERRRRYVLGQMLDKGMIAKAEHDEALAAPVSVLPVENVFREFAPYFTEEVRRSVVERYGNPTLLDQGLRIFTTMDSEKQRAAQDSVLTGLLAVDKRQGYRGPVLQLKETAERARFVEGAKAALGGEALALGAFYVALVTDIDRSDTFARVDIGGVKAVLPLLGMRWARPLNAEKYYPSVLINRVSEAVAVGDVVVVRVVKDAQGLVDDKEQWSEAAARAVPKNETLVRLEQEPELQSAIVSIDPHRQYLVAMVGGYDFDANEYNRAFQACRQPGSSFKPIVYSAAIELMNYTQGTIVLDSPIVYDDPENQNRWKPENFDEGFEGEMVLYRALVKSKNVPAVKLFIDLARFLGKKNEVAGIKAIGEYAARLGFTTPINPDYSTALGSACVYPRELAEVYALFDRLGEKRPTYFIRKVEDRFGRTLEDHTSWDDPWASLQDRIAAGYARLFEPGEQVLSRASAFLLTDIMRGVVREGTGAPASALRKPAAGKTGTTNDSFDAWFSGFTKDLVSTVWVGYDLNPHPLGKYETGGRAALPIWLGYMSRALQGRQQPEFDRPEDLDLVRVRVDAKTGRVTTSAKGAETLWFKRGTEPEDSEPAKGAVDSAQFMMKE